MECIYIREGPDINFHVPFHCPIKFETATFFYVRSESVTERTIKNPTEKKKRGTVWKNLQNCTEWRTLSYGQETLDMLGAFYETGSYLRHCD